MSEDKKDENIISSVENEENTEKVDNQPVVDENSNDSPEENKDFKENNQNENNTSNETETSQQNQQNETTVSNENQNETQKSKKPIDLIGNPIKFSLSKVKYKKSPPTLGQDTEKILINFFHSRQQA